MKRLLVEKMKTTLKEKIDKVIKELKDSGKIDQFVQDAYDLSVSGAE